MDEFKLSDVVFDQIKDFKYWELTEEQESLIDKLITNEELKERYKKSGLCENCKQPNTGIHYCQLCNSQHLKQNFKNWTSGNHNVDEFIQKAQLNAKDIFQIIEWIEYDKFEDVEYLAKGGFGTTFKAVWKDGYIISWHDKDKQWSRSYKKKVALKCLHNSQDITADFLKEIESNILISNYLNVVRCFGITKDPKTNNFMMVMDLKNGSLRQHLNTNFISLSWKQKLRSLEYITYGLECIHNKELIRHDFHCGNILSDFGEYAYVTDLGLCQPANVKSSQNSNKKIYGVLPYVAPEVLRGKEYTQKSDIYGFGIIAYELCTGFPPYHDIAHDEFLAMKICQGLRPKSNYKIPQLVVDVINQCWDADPLKRPNADELKKLFYNLYRKVHYNEVDSVIYKQVEEADEINKKSFSTVQSSFSHTTHPQAVYTSRLLDFKNLPEPKNADKNDDLEYSNSLKMDFTKLNITNSKGYYFLHVIFLIY
ncbi:kinase-like domain-containing protein [Rhizophagus diaphanus]|nr:kinase-like domain-containing protein [Rhizophagus diaphanus] [Rhizophagus sp. MUCL 43196]